MGRDESLWGPVPASEPPTPMPGSSPHPDGRDYDTGDFNNGDFNARNYDSNNYDSRNYDSRNYDSRNYDSRDYEGRDSTFTMPPQSGGWQTYAPPVVPFDQFAPTVPSVPDPRSRRRRNVAIVTVVAVLLAAGAVGAGFVVNRAGRSDVTALPTPVATVYTNPTGGGYGTSSSSGGSTTGVAPGTGAGSSAANQARAVDGLIEQDVAAHAKVPVAIAAANRCEGFTDAAQLLSDAASARDALVSTLQQTNLSALPGSATLTGDLAVALSNSAASDRSYALWVDDLSSSGCPQRKNANFARAAGTDQQATAAKTRFVLEWNPIASRYGLPARTVEDL